MGADREKACIVRRFTTGKERLCTATNMLSLSLQAPAVRVVIHVAMCKLLRHYIQESGRAGRTGLDSESIVLRACWQGPGGEKKALPHKLEQAAKDFLTGLACRR
ncbi:hypothetical protein CC86DRAFT_269556, partial [Ophiobolus disseminans]